KVYVGSDDNHIYCLAADTGVQIWNHTTSGGAHSSPAIAGGRVYAASVNFRIYCIADIGEIDPQFLILILIVAGVAVVFIAISIALVLRARR
ncbi:MAG: PQQ-binding-like beta-propeller repeat protein, partial [Candidatus Hodarchaeota archaeon]